MNSLTFTLISIALLAPPGWATAQPVACATNAERLPTMVSGQDAYALAKAAATKSNADSALLRMLTTMAGPLDAQGRSSEWMLEFFSPAGKKLTMVYLNSGVMTCSVTAVDGPFFGQPIGETPETIFDTARLIAIAGETGGSALDPASVIITAAFMRSNADAPAIWSISYVTPQGRPVFQVSIDSRSGAVTAKSPR
jgi:hypothetical protein